MDTSKPTATDFTAHSLERGLERIMGLEAPYTQKQYDDIRSFIIKSIEYNPFTNKWVIEEFGVELAIVENGTVVSTVPITRPKPENNSKPLTQFMKEHRKKYEKNNKERNKKSKDRR